MFDPFMKPPHRRGVLASLLAGAAALARPAWAKDQDMDVDLGPNVVVIDPSMPKAAVQARLDAIFRQQETAHFTDRRFAVLFKPGRYAVDCNIGYFTQVAGLGLSPDDVRIDGHVHVEADWTGGKALNNFWRGAENLSVTPPDGVDRWAASQAAPYRRMRLNGDLVLHDEGWASGGFIADSVITGVVRAGPQQQYLTRSSAIGGWEKGLWNVMFLGVRGAPSDTFPTPPVTTLAQAPRLREKPFLCLDEAGRWQIFAPAWRAPHQGASWADGPVAGRAVPLNRFLVARPDMPVRAMNAALASGRHLLLTPGVYRLSEPLRVTRPGTIVLGLGLATLLPTTGAAALVVEDVRDVALAGLLIDAGETFSPVLVRIGPKGRKSGSVETPVSLHDVFFRVGGAARGRAGVCLEINSDHVFGDHLWVWRADHGDEAGGRIHVGWEENPAEDGVVVDGDDVTLCGLFVEHFRRRQTLWNGERGRTYFYQSELPYDPPSQSSYMDGERRGWAAYKVAEHVQVHHATGLGVYCYYTADPSIVLESAIEAPHRTQVVFEHVTTVSLGGRNGAILHLVNEAGPAAKSGAVRQTLVRYPLSA